MLSVIRVHDIVPVVGTCLCLLATRANLWFKRLQRLMAAIARLQGIKSVLEPVEYHLHETILIITLMYSINFLTFYIT